MAGSSGQTPALAPSDSIRVVAWKGFAINRDSKGKTSWRQRTNPNEKHKFPVKHGDLVLGHKQSDTQNNDQQSVSLAVLLEQIGLQTGAFIEPPGKPDEHLVSVWGDIPQVTAAKKQLKALAAGVKMDKLKWTKQNSQSSNVKDVLWKQMQEESMRQAFCRNPPLGERFEEKGVFIWPNDRYPARELLGNNLEALDPIRMGCCVYLTLEINDTCICVHANNILAIKLALARIKAVLQELVVRNLWPTRHYLVDVPDRTKMTRNVVLLPRERVQGIPSLMENGVFGALTGPAPTSVDREKWLTLHPGYGRANRVCIEESIISELRKLKHFRGEVLMRARFGSLVLWSYKLSEEGSNQMTLEEYFEMLHNKQTIGEVLPLHPDNKGEMLNRLRAAKHIFAPLEVGVTDLKEVDPQLSISLELMTDQHPFVVRLVVNFDKDRRGNLLPGRAQWIMRGKTSMTIEERHEFRQGRVPLALIMDDPRCHETWEVAMVTSTLLEPGQITPAMKSFARNLRIDLPENFPKDQIFDIDKATVTFDSREVHILAYTLTAKHLYAIKNSPYIFEFTQERMTTRKPGQGKREFHTTPRTIWKGSMYGRDWDRILERHSYLQLGEVFDWDPAKLVPKTFFPDDHVKEGDGTQWFIDKAREIAWLIENPPPTPTASGNGNGDGNGNVVVEGMAGDVETGMAALKMSGWDDDYEDGEGDGDGQTKDAVEWPGPDKALENVLFNDDGDKDDVYKGALSNGGMVAEERE
ncbi:MAG: hypothetical protein M1823_005010 [Watsoniomyces obsoletus]|nr:MAG: hypothetical protein M1823_005010 [Watsoniomyces obsoletus]